MKNDMFIRIYVGKKFLMGYRILMLLIASFFLWSIYTAFDNGFAFSKGREIPINDSSFPFFVVREFAFALLFIWLGTGGASEKKADDKSDQRQKEENPNQDRD